MDERKKTVLILDDEANIRQSLADYFEDNLWHIILAESGEEALKILESESADGAIVDIRLPGITGDEFIRQACNRKLNMAYIICTGSPVYNVPLDLEKIPCVHNQVFRKPISDLAKLEKVLKQQIENINK